MRFVATARVVLETDSVSYIVEIITFHHVDFQHVLSSHLHPAIAKVHFVKRLSHYTKAPSAKSQKQVNLHFEGGTTAHCDVPIGADGIKSSTRRALLTEIAAAIPKARSQEASLFLEKVDPVWSGSIT